MASKSVRDPRLRKRLSVQFGEGYPLKGSGFTTNVSLRGLAITCQSLPVIGSKMVFDVKVPQGSCSMEGRIVWARRGSQMLQIASSFGVRLAPAQEPWLSYIQGEQRHNEVPVTGGSPAVVAAAPPARPPAQRPAEVDRGGAKQRLTRFPHSLDVRFGTTNQPTTLCRSADVSATGIAVITPTPLPTGSRVYLSVRLPAGQTSRLEGTVVRVKSSALNNQESRMAVRFTLADEAWYLFVYNLGRA